MKRRLPEFGGPVDFYAFAVVGPEVQLLVKRGEIETNAFASETFDESMQLVAEIVERIAGE